MEFGVVDYGICSFVFVGWEVYIRGIGFRFFVKMGYEFGKGEYVLYRGREGVVII